MELILTGDIITAQEAERIGLVNHVVPHEALGSKVREIAEKIASKSLLALKLTKLAAIRGLDLDLESAEAYEMVLGSLSFDTGDVKEGFKAFLDKRKPNFKGK